MKGDIRRAALHQIMSALKEAKRSDTVCKYVDKFGNRCTAKALGRSHTLQRKGPISAVADKRRQLYTARVDPFRDVEIGPAYLERVGWKKASSFPGFCEEHDRILFESFERDTSIFPEPLDALKMAYRTLCMHLYSMEAEMRAHDDLQESQNHLVQTFVREMQWYRNEQDFGRRDLLLEKEIYEAAILSNDIDRFQVAAIQISHALPFCFSSFVPAAYDFVGKRIMGKVGQFMPRTAFIGGRFGDAYLLIIGGMKQDGDEIGTEALLRTTQRLHEMPVGDVAFHIAMAYSSRCCFFSTDWIEEPGSNRKVEISRVLNLLHEAFLQEAGNPLQSFVNLPHMFEIDVIKLAMHGF